MNGYYQNHCLTGCGGSSEQPRAGDDTNLAFQKAAQKNDGKIIT